MRTRYKVLVVTSTIIIVSFLLFNIFYVTYPDSMIQDISEWSVKYVDTMPTVIIPKGAVIEGHEMLIPKVITVVLGINNTVTWINEDDTTHGITSDNGPDGEWGTSGVLKPGEMYSHTFNESGIFSYHGAPHPWMTSTVIVLEE